MNINAYAYLIDTVHTVMVRFYGERNDYTRNEIGTKDYTYLSTKHYDEGEHVIVDVAGVPKAVLVTGCDTGVPQDAQKELKWIIGPAYNVEHEAFIAKITQLKKQVATVYATSAKKRMRDVLLAEMGVTSVEELLQLKL